MELFGVFDIAESIVEKFVLDLKTRNQQKSPYSSLVAQDQRAFFEVSPTGVKL